MTRPVHGYAVEQWPRIYPDRNCVKHQSEEATMAKLIYSAIASLDGYVEDEQGGFEWAAPDEEVHAFVNDLERRVGLYLYGRRMYKTMAYWEAQGDGSEDSPASRDFAQIWRRAEKVVYSRTLEATTTAKTRIERNFDPDAIQRLKDIAESDVTIGGAELAGQAIAAGRVDELQLLLVPVLVGGGKPALPANVRTRLDLLDERRFNSGAVFLRYRVRPA
jgi:dihydrofolate reductase